MTSEELQTIIAAGLSCEHLEVSGDGSHWYATMVSSAFQGLSRIARHHRAYATVGNRIQTGEVHALSMKTYTPAEWASLKAQ
ncbi:BolA family protein [Polaromonas sp. CG_9.11]|uniref:BolA family protein n=1 Tax=Polaromonas sp. CG_9.11 TaxID=2787730 RepID=UPI0018CB54AF|nr:BolA family protein [Polaromonas sp. CG_9.11]MBG6075981.1 acid stress-induced BolA-like protein IbaG/YrbA [Polaromonas sp. CG_9.11]